MQQIKWTIEQLIREKSSGVVKKAEWLCIAEDVTEDGSVMANTGCTGTVSLPETDPNAQGFVSFDALTEDMVVVWVRECLTPEVVEQYEQQLLSELNLKLNPVEATGTPW
jgi:hypothetical protein